MLSLERCEVFYGKAQALHDVSLDVSAGEVVSLVGRNGAGKSTLLKAAIGLLPLKGGVRRFQGRDVTALPAFQLSRMGISYVPENRRIFPTLTVEENLRLPTLMRRRGAWTLPRIYEMFPALQERAARMGPTLSGGEQQMLAIGRGLLANPDILLLDEPTEGLAPRLVEDLTAAMAAVKRQGTSILLVEQNFTVAIELAERQFVIDNGRILWSGTTVEMLARRDEIERIVSL